MIKIRFLIILALPALTHPAWSQDFIRLDLEILTGTPAHEDLLAKARVAGSAGLDFELNLSGEPLRIQARFVTDPDGKDQLRVRFHLEIRRFYGISPRDRPLYEVEEKRYDRRVRYGESLDIYPMGKREGGPNLRIAVIPSRRESGHPRIEIPNPGPNGLLTITMRKIPHRFTVAALLMENGRIVARGRGRALYWEETEMALTGPGGANRHLLRLNVVAYRVSRPEDVLTIRFSLSQTIDLLRGAGGCILGQPMVFQIGEEGESGRELHITLEAEK